jgi:hypothetical protein
MLLTVGVIAISKETILPLIDDVKGHVLITVTLKCLRNLLNILIARTSITKVVAVVLMAYSLALNIL